jgi:carotenoid cleavage dioxygenase
MSAHPKIDPMTGEMIAYGYQAKGILSKDIAVYTINPQGHIVKEVWLQSPYLGIIHDIAITQKHVIIPVISRTTSEARLKSGEPMWEWQGDLPTMVGILPRDGEAKDVRWFKGPSRNTLHFLNASDAANNTVTMELPVSDEERSPSQIKRWTFNMNGKSDAFGEEVISRSNGVLARMDDRYLSLPYRYGFVGHTDPEKPYDTAAGGNRAGRVTNCYKRFDLKNPTAPESTFFVGNVQSLQEAGFIPRKGSTAESDGYVVGIASNYAEMASELHIVDAQRMEEGAVAVVKLPFRLRSGTHVNWFSADDLAAQTSETV